MEMPDKHSKRDNAFDKLIRRLNTAKEKISELKDRSNENIKKKKIGRKKKKPTKETIIQNLWNKSNGPTYM